jgi:hypothetical protein
MTAVLLIICVLSGGCRHNQPYKPYVHPTREQIMALAQVEKPAEVDSAPFSMKLLPQTTMAYTDAKVTCLLPRDAAGKYTFGIIGEKSEAGEVDWRQRHFYVKVGCYLLVAYCTYTPRIQAGEYGPMQLRTLEINPIGDCR